MNKNLAIGTQVVLKEGHCKGTLTISRYGEVVEIGTGAKDGRLRIKWNYTERTQAGGTQTYPMNRNLRTWIRCDRLMVVPTEIL